MVHVDRTKGGKSAFNIVTGKLNERELLGILWKRALGKPRRRWEKNIRIGIIEICVNTRN